jgi:hypothetical protein
MGFGITIVAKIVRLKTRKKQFKIDTEFFSWVFISAISFWITQLFLVSFFYIRSGLLYFILMGCGVYVISLFLAKILVIISDASKQNIKPIQPIKPVKYGKNIKIEKEIFNSVNKERKKRNIHALTWNDSLYQTAQRRANEITRNFSHQGVPAGFGENIAMVPIGKVRSLGFIHRYNVAKAFLKIWMKSTGHRENILRGQYNTCCIGVAQNKGKYYGVQLFS